VTSLDLLSKYVLIMEFRFYMMLCSNLGNKTLLLAISNVNAGHKFPNPGLVVVVSLLAIRKIMHFHSK